MPVTSFIAATIVSIMEAKSNESVQKVQTCSRCGEHTDGDIRYLRMSCLYDMAEIGIKELKFNEQHNNYILPICKECRGNFMFTLLPNWFYQKRNHIPPAYELEITRLRARLEQVEELLRSFADHEEPMRMRGGV